MASQVLHMHMAAEYCLGHSGVGRSVFIVYACLVRGDKYRQQNCLQSVLISYLLNTVRVGVGLKRLSELTCIDSYRQQNLVQLVQSAFVCFHGNV